MRTLGIRFAVLLTLFFMNSAPAASQYVVGAGVDYLGYSFEQGLGADAAQLFMIPLAVRIPVSEAVTVDLFTAWAEGRVEQENRVPTFNGLVDTSVKASYAATPWALVSLGVNVPTGSAEHTGDEAIVASVLSTDLLGFREATWGTGFAVTSSVAMAMRAGGFGVGLGGAYAMRGEFTPSVDSDLTYQPGSETRIRLGLDRNFGNSTLTAGATLINYSDDLADRQDGAGQFDLFAAGKRLRFDAAYAFRAGAGLWTFYGADLIRENGDLRLDIIDETNVVVSDTTVVTAKQNMLVAGFMGTVALGGGFVFRPHVDFKRQAREEADGNLAGSGWVLAAGGDIPLRIFGGYEFFPKARVVFGSIKNVMEEPISTLGLEFKGTIRWTF